MLPLTDCKFSVFLLLLNSNTKICVSYCTGEELIGLDTVKKGTPLYGQPDWWGDDGQTQNCTQERSPNSNKGNSAYLICYQPMCFFE